jgi:PhzF family phenazine biosynthesis protein
MIVPIYQVDAFTERTFDGNPAAVCPLESWLTERHMQFIAAENNLSETAFFVPEGDGFRLRWFTPEVEVDLCGHATLAAAAVLYREMGYERPQLRFRTMKAGYQVRRSATDAPTPDRPDRRCVLRLLVPLRCTARSG